MIKTLKDLMTSIKHFKWHRLLFCVSIYNCLLNVGLTVQIIDCVRETWDIHKIFNVFESQV